LQRRQPSELVHVVDVDKTCGDRHWQTTANDSRSGADCQFQALLQNVQLDNP
jgi:hypothetical protein